MKKTTDFKISTTISDFAPLFFDQEYMFKGLENTGVDGIELVVGLKSRWSVDKIKRLSKKYNLPITSLHQPVWAGLGLYFDEGFFNIAVRLGVQSVVCHPIPGYSFQDKQMKAYLQRLSLMQKSKGIDVLLENLSPTYENKLVDSFFRISPDTNDMKAVYAAASEYDLQITLDIDHLNVPRPQKESWFEGVLPKIGNIHLSSFSKTKYHLPLYMGDFQIKEFMQYLQKVKYQGLITLEIYYPRFINPVSYDFNPIKKSIDFIRSC